MKHENEHGSSRTALREVTRRAPGRKTARVAGVTSIVLVSLLHPFSIASVVALAALAVRPRRGGASGDKAERGATGRPPLDGARGETA